jgi:non-canonical poly(A) RNA polymerase PAPD5/7
MGVVNPSLISSVTHPDSMIDSYEQISAAPPIIPRDRHSVLSRVEQAVRLSSFDIQTNYLRTARIPIIKVKHNKTGIRADVGYGAVNGVLNSDYVRCLLVVYRQARPLIVIVKAFLASQDLNEPYHGGLGGYPLALLAVSHLQQFRRNYGEEWKTASLGVLNLLFYFFFYLLHFLNILKEFATYMCVLLL